MDIDQKLRSRIAPIGLAACAVISAVMWVLKPIPHGYRYDLAFVLSVSLAVIGLMFGASPGLMFKKVTLAVVLVLGLALGLRTLAKPDFNLEIVRHYESVFKAIDSGGNPYTSGTIFHMGEGGQTVYGNFNYPPVEIYPYYLAYRIAGTWNSVVFTATVLLLNALCCLVFVLMFPRIRWPYLIPYFLVFLFLEVKTNPAMAFLVTALILLLVRLDARRPRPAYRYFIAVLFGVGLATKFFVIPLMAAYYWHKFDLKKLRSLALVVPDVAMAMATTVLIMLPYGVAAVFKNTILFNLVLKDRAVLTTFYPNVLSGLFTWLNLSDLYPAAAILILGLSILVAPKLNVYSAMLAATLTFLLVAPTPRAQFVPVVIYLALTGILANLQKQGKIPVEARAEG